MSIDSVRATPGEMAAAARWAGEHLAGENPPISFVYDGRPFAETAAEWSVRTDERGIGDGRREITATFSHGQTGLAVRCVAVTYADFPVVEWTPYLENRGGADTPIIESIRALDVVFNSPTPGEFILHHWVGSIASAGDFEPRTTKLEPQTLSLSTRGGYSSDLTMPYFNVEWNGGGAIAAVGWPGQWAAEFTRESRASCRVTAGQERTRFVLRPGESVRGPLIALLFHEGGFVRSQNVWRRWMLAHNLPKINGRVPAPFMPAGSSGQFSEMENADEANQMLFIDRYVEERIGIDVWWMDAGWYVTPDKWWKTGTWEVDKRRFPRGLRAVTDHARSRGLKALVWFEPERVYRGTALYEEHPDWLLGCEGDTKVLNLGNPDARAWAVEHFDRLIRDEGVDIYRQDFNTWPLPYWRANDEPQREGVTEIRHVEGYLAYWDELRRRHPDMLIDTCASGGRRLDLETLRRSVPLHKSDHDYGDYENRQCQFYGISFLVPFHGAPVCRGNVVDKYVMRSGYAPMTALGFDVRRDDLDYALLRRLAAEWRRVSRFYSGDYYPLTSYSKDLLSWLAWQFHRPDPDEGLVQVFRRSASPYESAVFRLHNLDADATYIVEDLDVSGTSDVSGRELMERGLAVGLHEKSSAALITYAKKPRS